MIINQVVSGGGSSVSEPYVNWTVSSNGELISTSNHIMDFTGVTNLNVGMRNAYANNTNITGVVDMSDITTFSGDFRCTAMFYGCTGLTSVDLSSLQYISGTSCCQDMFYGCTGLTSVNLSNIKQIYSGLGCGSMFSGCSGLTSINLGNLLQIGGNGNYATQSMFQGCTGLITVNLDSLERVQGQQACSGMFSNCTNLQKIDFCSLSSINATRCLTGMFTGCTSLQTVSFYALSTFGSPTNQFTSMLNGVTGCTVHFPIAVQSTIGSWSDVTNGFGGTNTTVSFDIVTSLVGADTSTYTRKQKESTSTATAWVDGNDVLFYTSGTSEPTVGATIYSDSACTTAVTTISSIS